MRRLIHAGLVALSCLALAPAASGQGLPADADGNGSVGLDDARTIARYLVGQLQAIAQPGNADANQDGRIDMEDAFLIARQATGQTRIVVVAPLHGSSQTLPIGSIVRVEVFERFFPFNIRGGTVRIRSASTGFDSGDQSLTFERNGRSLYYHWNTVGLTPASDYSVSVTLNNPSGRVVPAGEVAALGIAAAQSSEDLVTLTKEAYRPRYLAVALDAYCPAPGLALEFRRWNPNNAPAYPYLGPLGRGWIHSYDLKLEEHTDGRVTLFDRSFTGHSDGRYDASPGDYGVLTRDSNGSYKLTEKGGSFYWFRPDLRLDYIQDLNGNRISAVYDAGGHLTQVRHSSGTSLALEYNGAGRIASLTDHAGRVTRYDYDSTGALLLQVTDPAGGVTRYSYAFRPMFYVVNFKIVCMHDGAEVPCPREPNVLDYRLNSIAYPDGSFVHYQFDTSARLVKQTSTWGAHPVLYTYDADGTTRVTDALGSSSAMIVNDSGQPTSVTAPDSSRTSYQYDGDLNLIAVTDPLSGVSRFAYDGAGNLTRQIDPLGQSVDIQYDARFNLPSSIRNALGQTTSFGYDARGNLLSITYPDATRAAFTYDARGNLLTVRDPAGRTTSYSYGTLGQPSSFRNALGHTTDLSSDSSGALAALTDARGEKISHSRDLRGRLTRRTYPDATFEGFQYDSVGKVTSITSRRGDRITFAYDATGRLEWKTYPSGRKVHYQYDAAGYLTRVENVDGATTLDAAYERDARHRITKASVPGASTAEAYAISYEHDAAGRRVRMAYPDGYVLSYAYDGANRLLTISDADGNALVSYQYDRAGRRTRRSLGNGTYATYSYDLLDRLTELVNYAPDGSVQSRFIYTYNATGIRTSMTTLEGVHSYSYDDTYQLTRVQYPDGHAVDYAFDAVGNRTSVGVGGTVSSYTTNSLNQYTQAGNETLAYDPNGNLTSRTSVPGMTSFDWDEDGRLVAVNRVGLSIAYGYDSGGRLITKSVGANEKRYVWDGFDLVAEYDSSGSLAVRNVYGSAIDELIVAFTGGHRYWGQQDGLGSVIGVTDDTGAVVATASYDVYGSLRSGGTGPLPQRLAGMRWDDDAGLYHVRARWLDPALGRFVSVDPLQPPSGTNAYAYVGNSPVSRIDPSGLSGLSDLARYAGKALGGGTVSWLDVTEAVGRAGLDLIGAGGLADLAALAGRALGGGSVSTLDVSEAVGRAGMDLLPGVGDLLGDLAALAGRSLGGGSVTLGELSETIGKGGLGALSELKGLGGLDSVGDLLAEAIGEWGPDLFPPAVGQPTSDASAGGGICPTFIQSPLDAGPTTAASSSPRDETLHARIDVPVQGSLLRSDIPIFGIAGGREFKSFRVEVGAGADPREWQTIEASDKPQNANSVGSAQAALMQGDLDIRGNLATWNSGLKEWVHLPWHPPEEAIEYNGIYTIRLVVEGKDGRTVEDRVTGEVGRVVAQCLPGTVVSPDRRVTMRFPEQALSSPFRVFTILPLEMAGEDAAVPKPADETIGPIYRVREPGDRFIKDVTLEFAPRPEELGARSPRHVGIARYDAARASWVAVDTALDAGHGTFTATLAELPATKAIYALVHNPAKALSRPVVTTARAPQPPAPARPGVLIDNTFESGLGTIAARDRHAGAALSIELHPAPHASRVLKVHNETFGGNLAVTLLDAPFDVREYDTMTFTYRVPADVRTDFYLRVAGRWHRLGFTGEPADFRFRDVNIADTGTIEGIVADDTWRVASVDLRAALATQTRHTVVDELVMASWRVGGYMKLEFGDNARGATYYLDDFALTGPGRITTHPSVLLVDDFSQRRQVNSLGEATGVYNPPGWTTVGAEVDGSAVTRGAGAEATRTTGVLRLDFNVGQPGSYGGYWTSISKVDLSAHAALAFKTPCDTPVPPMSIGIRNARGLEGRTRLAPYAAAAPCADGWRDVRVPLSALRGLPGDAAPDVLFFAFAFDERSGTGVLRLSDIRFEQASTTTVANFEDPAPWTLLGGDTTTFQNGAAVISAGRMTERAGQVPSTNTVMRLSYGGTIGLDYGANGGFSYAGWRAGLGGIDARPFASLTMRIRGEKGGEAPNIYVSDGARRYPLRAKEFPAITTQWQTVAVPLDHFARQGIDLSHLDAVEIVFEWTEQSGTIYVDDVALASRGAAAEPTSASTGSAAGR